MSLGTAILTGEFEPLRVGLERPYYELSSLLWTCEFWSTSSQNSPLAANVTGSPRNVVTREARLSRREGFV